MLLDISYLQSRPNNRPTVHAIQFFSSMSPHIRVRVEFRPRGVWIGQRLPRQTSECLPSALHCVRPECFIGVFPTLFLWRPSVPLHCSRSRNARTCHCCLEFTQKLLKKVSRILTLTLDLGLRFHHFKLFLNLTAMSQLALNFSLCLFEKDWTWLWILVLCEWHDNSELQQTVDGDVDGTTHSLPTGVSCVTRVPALVWQTVDGIQRQRAVCVHVLTMIHRKHRLACGQQRRSYYVASFDHCKWWWHWIYLTRQRV